MKKLIGVVALCVLFAGCGSANEPADEKGQIQSSCAAVQSNLPEDVYGTVYCLTIDGYPCYIWKQKVGDMNNSRGYGGLSCDYGDK